MEEKSKNDEEGVDEGIEENASDGGSDSKKVSFNFISTINLIAYYRFCILPLSLPLMYFDVSSNASFNH